jgi:hypothetical protein
MKQINALYTVSHKTDSSGFLPTCKKVAFLHVAHILLVQKWSKMSKTRKNLKIMICTFSRYLQKLSPHKE